METMDDLIYGVGEQKRKRASSAKKAMMKQKKKPVKVVYISNPMRVSTSASSFRDLVQRLTGQDSEFPDNSPDSVVERGVAVAGGDPNWELPLDGVGATMRPADKAGLEFGRPEEGFMSPRALESSFSEFLPDSFLYDSSSHL